jgi:hypothetical protein
MMLPKRGLLLAGMLIGAALGHEVAALFAQSNQYERATTCGTVTGIVLGLIVGVRLDIVANRTEQRTGKPARLNDLIRWLMLLGCLFVLFWILFDWWTLR